MQVMFIIVRQFFSKCDGILLCVIIQFKTIGFALKLLISHIFFPNSTGSQDIFREA